MATKDYQKLYAQIPDIYAQTRSLNTVARILGIDPETARRTAHKMGVPVAPFGRSPRGPSHPQWNSGRVVDRDGYVLVSCDANHPGCRKIHAGRRTGRILEHRIMAEIKLGRYLSPGEVVDHIDGCKFHNDPVNLQVYQSNADHLRNTISGQVPKWSKKGKQKTLLSRWHPEKAASLFPERIDTHDQNKKRGDVRKQQILLGRELLGTQSLWFLGMKTHFLKIGIDWPFDQKTEDDLKRKYFQILLAHPALKLWLQG